MGNTIDWGQAAVNNTIGFGDGAENNTIGWGDIQADSWSPETNLTGTGATPAYSNVNSFTFDGTTDYFNGVGTYSELDGLNKATWSIWIKPINTGVDVIFHNPRNTTQQNSQFLLWIYEGARIDFSLETTAKFIRGDISGITFGAWNHIMVCVDYTLPNADKGRIFVNGVDATTSLNLSSNPQTFETASNELFIGEDANGYQSPYGGNLDEFSIWAGTDQRANVSEIYNAGIPNDLNTLPTAPQPTTWFRMGEEAVFGTQWTMTDVNGGYVNTSATLPAPPTQPSTDVPPNPFASTKSFSFDGIGDYITMGNDTSLQPSNFTVCLWVKPLNHGSRTLIHNGAELWGNSITGFYISESYANYYFKIGDGTTVYTLFNSGLLLNTWQFITLSYDGVNMKTYLDGVLQGTLAVPNISYGTNASWNPFYIGRTSAGGAFMDGKIDEISLFNTALSQANIDTIYGSGVPTSLTSLSPLGWWRMGEEAAYTTLWTLTDQGSGGNDGTSSSIPAPPAQPSTDVPT